MDIALGLILGIAFGTIQYLIWRGLLKKPSFSSNTYKVIIMGLISIFAIFMLLLAVALLKIDLLIWTASGVLISTFMTTGYTFIKDRRRNK